MARESRTGIDDVGFTPSVSARDHFADDLRDTGTKRSHFASFLLGGVVIAGGMLAFLYYDTGNLSAAHDDLTTGSIIKLDTTRPATAPNIAIPVKKTSGGEPSADR